MQASHQEITHNASPFQKRYQVFVSSTYEDLKEERRHVMQALLESKCIPAGMELFPAASTKQWDLIKRVIDESDYYIVVVAGRYGSRATEGLSYTEMEFDYALQTGKPVIGFYHENVLDLPGSKLEKTDAGKEALARFTDKVKSQLCRAWRSPEALGSAVKSAVFHEIEFNPQPGWVRASSQADPALLLKLKQRIADLETQIALAKSRAVTPKLAPKAEEVIKVEIDFHLKAKEPYPDNKWRSDQRVETIALDVPWPVLFRPVGLKLKKPKGRAEIGMMLRDAAIEHANLDVQSFVPNGFQVSSIRLNKDFGGRIIDRLLADKLIQEVQTTKHERWATKRVHEFKLTQKGLHWAATLRASNQ